MAGQSASDIWKASDDALVKAVAVAESQMRQAYSRMLGLLAELDARAVATKLGYSNTPALLVQTLRISRRRLDIGWRRPKASLTPPQTGTGAVVEAAMPSPPPR